MGNASGHSSTDTPQALTPTDELIGVDFDSEFDDPTNRIDSPLRFVATDPLIHELVRYLAEQKDRIGAAPDQTHTLRFSKRTMADTRLAFAQTIRQGEVDLHRLCQLLCNAYLGSYQIQSVVIGEVVSTHQRFTFIEDISTSDLYSTTDLDLGNRQLSRLKYYDGSAWVGAALVANMVEYQPSEPNKLAIHKFISRIKAEEEIWNKVADEIFSLDQLVLRDKKLRRLSRYVKDIFGLKIVVGTPEEVTRVQQLLSDVTWSAEALQQVGVPCDATTTRLGFIEIKDYLVREDRKRTGWQALKSVVRWHQKTFEIQVQPLRNFLRERERLTKESHAGFKAQREAIRNEIASQIPLFSFYRDLLRWLFVTPTEQPPRFENVTIVLDE